MTASALPTAAARTLPAVSGASAGPSLPAASDGFASLLSQLDSVPATPASAGTPPPAPITTLIGPPGQQDVLATPQAAPANGAPLIDPKQAETADNGKGRTAKSEKTAATPASPAEPSKIDPLPVTPPILPPDTLPLPIAPVLTAAGPSPLPAQPASTDAPSHDPEPDPTSSRPLSSSSSKVASPASVPLQPADHAASTAATDAPSPSINGIAQAADLSSPASTPSRQAMPDQSGQPPEQPTGRQIQQLTLRTVDGRNDVHAPVASMPGHAAPSPSSSAKASDAQAAELPFPTLATAVDGAPSAVVLPSTAPSVPTPAAIRSQSPEPLPSPPAVQVAQALVEPVKLVLASPAHAAEPHVTTVQIAPAELGRVDIRIERVGDGPARIQLVAERAETLSRLVDDRSALHRALDGAGLPWSERTIEFSLAPSLSAYTAPSLDLAGGSSSGGSTFNQGSQRQSFYSPQFLAASDDAPADPFPLLRSVRSGIDITA